MACVGLVWMQVALKEDLDILKERFRTSKWSPFSEYNLKLFSRFKNKSDHAVLSFAHSDKAIVHSFQHVYTLFFSCQLECYNSCVLIWEAGTGD